jgi:hypothetical protein
LSHKGGGKPTVEVASYRPITLLNCDVTLLARVMVARMTPALDVLVDGTQSALVPAWMAGGWIGDNVLYNNLEEVEYCQTERQAGCVVFLDFEKAYYRVDRGWLFTCLHGVHGVPS